MKKQKRVDATLKTNGEHEYVVVKNKDGKASVETLINYLRNGIKNREIKNGKIVQNDICVKYIFDVYSYDEKLEKENKSLFVVRIDNKEKEYHYLTINVLESMCEMTAQIKKTNRARVIAGISVGLFILVAAGPRIAKGIGDAANKESQYDQERYNKTQVDVITQQDIDNMNEEYYKDLEQKAKSGDVEAMNEYIEYILGQQSQENLNNSKTR